MQRLETLRAYLYHFDISPDVGDGEAVAAIREHLMMRIRELESSIRCPDWARPHTEVKNPTAGAFPLGQSAEAA